MKELCETYFSMQMMLFPVLEEEKIKFSGKISNRTRPPKVRETELHAKITAKFVREEFSKTVIFLVFPTFGGRVRFHEPKIFSLFLFFFP